MTFFKLSNLYDFVLRNIFKHKQLINVQLIVFLLFICILTNYYFHLLMNDCLSLFSTDVCI